MTHTTLIAIQKTKLTKNLPDIKAGMKVKVWYKIPEKDKARTTFFEGIVIAVKHGRASTNGMFTVRKIAVDNVGVEMTWPLHAPIIEKIEVLQTAKTRRNKLYYLRARSRKQVRSKLHKKGILAELAIPATEPEPEPDSETEAEPEAKK